LVEDHIGINITSENPGIIHCALTEDSGEQYFAKINNTFNIIGDNQSHLLLIRIFPFITTFPGEYHFTLNITGLFTYSEKFSVFLGMGYSLFTIVLSFLAVISLIIILKHRHENKLKKTKVDTTSQLSPPYQSLSKGKISCPSCKKPIDEGLSFCPECGERIPEFLRYNPNS
jgi:hypothetical protein